MVLSGHYRIKLLIRLKLIIIFEPFCTHPHFHSPVRHGPVEKVLWSKPLRSVSGRLLIGIDVVLILGSILGFPFIFPMVLVPMKQNSVELVYRYIASVARGVAIAKFTSFEYLTP